MARSNIQIKTRSGSMEIYSSCSDLPEKDDSKRKSRNLSEKKRRDQFNTLINELSAVVTTRRKMDKSAVLSRTIEFLKIHNENASKSRNHQIDESWKSPYLSNDQFTHLMLEAVGGFIIVFSSRRTILYVSDNFTSLLGYTPEEVMNSNLFSLIYSDDHARVSAICFPPLDNDNAHLYEGKQISFQCRCIRKGCDPNDLTCLELIEFTGFIRRESKETQRAFVFVGTGRLQTPQLLREVIIADTSKLEFCSHHNVEWKYIFVDHRASSIIGYSPFEIVGTSGFDYCHLNDLDKLTSFHETLKEKGKGISGYYRFLTKGQQWIWLQTKCYVTYHYWLSRPETIFCTHRVVSNLDAGENLWKPELHFSDNSNSSVKTLHQNTVNNQLTVDSVSDVRSVSSESSSNIFRNEDYFLQNSVPSVNVITGEQTISTIDSITDVPLIDVTFADSNDIPVNTIDNNDSLITSYDNSFLQAGATTAADALYAPTTLETSLQKRHEELQQAILQRQQELRLVSEQLLMARCGLYQSLPSEPLVRAENNIYASSTEDNLQHMFDLPLEQVLPESELTSLDDSLQDSSLFSGMLNMNTDAEL